MTINSNLYPLKFKPILKSIIWGGSDITSFKNIEPIQDGIGESWEISGVEGDISIIENGHLAGTSLKSLLSESREKLVGAEVYHKFGNKFPLLIKFIDAQDDLSIQVHPDDKLAGERHNSFGKTEMWYVVKAAPGAFLYTGFEKDISPHEYEKSIEDNSFTDSLKKHTVKEGDVFFLPAGRVHAIGAGCFIAEIQQTSNITYRIYDYNRKDAQGNSRELHTELAKDAIDFKLYDTYQTEYNKELNKPVELVTCPYFTTNLLELNEFTKRDYSKKDSFVIYMCLEGSLNLVDNKGNSLFIERGESLLIPAETNYIEISPNNHCKLLEVFAG
ncbi:MAG: class I mannose-6-phosphate isomerase [Fermentimonas sp.]|nr:class I mannose-6-phosphate isomerase [Fermentimonas sp.]